MENLESRISIVIRPPKNISDKIMEVKKETGVYYPGYEESFPHISLYHCKFEESKYPELLKIMSNFVSPTLNFTLTDLKFLVQPKRNSTFIYFNVLESEKLQKLHEQIVEIVNPFRGDLIRFKDVERYKSGKMTEEEFEYTKKYGFLYFMERYNPHITIGTIDIGDFQKEKTLKDKLDALAGQKFEVDTIFIRLKRRSIPDETVIFKSETTKIQLK